MVKIKEFSGMLSFYETLNGLISVFWLILAGEGVNRLNRARSSVQWDNTVFYNRKNVRRVTAMMIWKAYTLSSALPDGDKQVVVVVPACSCTNLILRC